MRTGHDDSKGVSLSRRSGDANKNLLQAMRRTVHKRHRNGGVFLLRKAGHKALKYEARKEELEHISHHSKSGGVSGTSPVTTCDISTCRSAVCHSRPRDPHPRAVALTTKPETLDRIPVTINHAHAAASHA